jgi:hypothetical protein
MTGTSAATVALTGAGTGLTLNIATGTAVLNNIWKATCAGLADQSGNGKDYTQATASKQTVITTGLNGKAGIASDGVDDLLHSALVLPAPGTTPFVCVAVFRSITWQLNGLLTGADAAVAVGNIFQSPGAGQIRCSNGIVGPINTGAVDGSWVELEYKYSNAAGDTQKLGITTVSGNCGNGTSASGMNLFARSASQFGKFELLMAGYVPAATFSAATFRAAVKAVAGYGAGNVLV